VTPLAIGERRAGSETWSRSSWAGVLATVVVGLTIAAVWQKGAFFPTEAAVVMVGSLVVIVLSLVVRANREELLVTAAVGALTLWWLVSALIHHHGGFLPEGASMLGFLAAFLGLRNLPNPSRGVAVTTLVAIGAVCAVVGLWAVAFRAYPLAMPAQGLWRTATSLTYSNAAGCLFAMVLLVALGPSHGRRWHRVAVAVLVAALLATESRGAVLAFVAALPIVPLHRIGRAAWSGLLGLAAGVVVVATSDGSARQPAAFAAVIVAVGVAAFLPPARRPHLDRRQRAGIAGLAVVVLALAGWALHTPVSLRLQTGSSDDRTHEWTAAFDQWRTAPVIGVGPDLLLRLDTPTPSYDRFAHNEYLQILADGGLVAIVLLGASGAAVMTATHRRDVATSCATAAVVAFAVAGALDFDWHLPALALVAGWAAGTAGPSALRPSPSDDADSSGVAGTSAPTQTRSRV
jgi:O-antigen ligase